MDLTVKDILSNLKGLSQVVIGDEAVVIAGTPPFGARIVPQYLKNL